MIPQQYITEWSEFAPWQANEQVEQNLIICRSLVELFSDEFIAERLAFRGGTALHKLFLEPQSRYSEDIDLVQISAESFGPSIDKIRKLLSFLGEPKIKQKDRNTTMVFTFESEIQPVQVLKIKVETNCREHFSVFNLKNLEDKMNDPEFLGYTTALLRPAEIYNPEEGFRLVKRDLIDKM
jgi:predicted nucleotidyltransferase component of viral defense system